MRGVIATRLTVPGPGWQVVPLTPCPGPKRIHIPKAPPLGLLLEAPQFKTYNDKLRSNSHNVPADEQRDPVDFGLYKEDMHAFKVKYIYEKLRQEELEFNV
jgi:tRNA pseudouridine38-40 synthase